MSALICVARQRAVVDPDLVDQALELLAPDVVGAEGQRARARRCISPTSGCELDLRAVHEEPQHCAVEGRGEVRPLVRVEVLRAVGAGVRVDEHARRRAVDIGVGVERVVQAARRTP